MNCYLKFCLYFFLVARVDLNSIYNQFFLERNTHDFIFLATISISYNKASKYVVS